MVTLQLKKRIFIHKTQAYGMYLFFEIMWYVFQYEVTFVKAEKRIVEKRELK